MATWTYRGSFRDGLAWSQRAVAVLGADVVAILRGVEIDGLIGLLSELRELAQTRDAAEKMKAIEGAKPIDVPAMLEKAKAVMPADMAEIMLARLGSPEALDLALDLAGLCAIDGEPFDADAPLDGMTIGEVVAGALGVARSQALFP